MSRLGPWPGMLATLALATLGGGLGLALRVPAGGIIGAVVAVGLVNLTTGKIPQLPASFRRNARILTGTVIGSGVGPHLLDSLGAFWLPALLMALWAIAVALVLGRYIGRRTGLDPATALFSFTPGGLSEMIMVSQDLGGDARLVGLIGMIRVLSTVVVVPLVLGYLVLRR